MRQSNIVSDLAILILCITAIYLLLQRSGIVP
jgi:hypothetical protein